MAISITLDKNKAIAAAMEAKAKEIIAIEEKVKDKGDFEKRLTEIEKRLEAIEKKEGK